MQAYFIQTFQQDSKTQKKSCKFTILLSEFFKFYNNIMLVIHIIIHLFQKQDKHIKTAEHVISIKKIHCTDHIIFQARHDIIYLVHVHEKSISIFKELETELYNKKT